MAEPSDNRTVSSRDIVVLHPDVILESVGPFGRFQRFWYILICLPCMFSAFITLSPAFTAAQPKFRCRVPHCDIANSTYQSAFDNGYANFSLPGNAECVMFQSNNESTTSCSSDNFDPTHIVKCPETKNRHIFDRDVFRSTMVTEFDLTCDEKWKVSFAESLFFVSVLIAALIFGLLADWLGRKHTFMIGITLMTLGGVGLSFAPSYSGYVGLQMIAGFGQLGVFQTAFVLGVENVGKEYRVLCGIGIEYFFVLGELMLTLVAYQLREWRKILLYPFCAATLFIFYWPLLPESLRWLLSRQKFDEAQVLTNNIARWNGKTSVKVQKDQNPEEESFQSITTVIEANEDSVFKALRSWVFVTRGLNICYCWFAVSMCFYGLSLNATNLSGDPFLNFFLVSLVEIPGYTLSYITMEKVGRKWSVAVSLIMGGVSLLVDPFISNHLNWLKIVMFLLGKIGVTSAFATIYLYTSELYPTSLRTLGVGTSSMFGRIGAIVSPYVSLLTSVSYWMPLFFFGLNALLSGCLILLLPETLGKNLPESLDEALRMSDYSVPNPPAIVVTESLEEEERESNSESDPLIL